MRTVWSALLGGLLGISCATDVAGAEISWGPGGAKDAPYVLVVPFAGFYLGWNGGGGSSSGGDQLALPGTFGGLGPSGGFGGVQVGYNWRSFALPRLVLGVEADVQASAIEQEARDIASDIFRSRLEFFSTVRGKVGYAMDRTLFYFTGGFAFGSLKNEASLFGPGADFVINTTSTGYVLGGGLEYKLNTAWSIKGEYQYLDLGRNIPKDPVFGPYTLNGGVVRDDAFHTVRVGLNFYMHRAAEPLK